MFVRGTSIAAASADTISMPWPKGAGCGGARRSRGLKAWMADGQGPISHHTMERLVACGIHVGDDVRFPVQLTAADLENADLVVAVKEAEHRPMMEEQFPQWANGIEYWHIDDLDCAPPEETLSHCQFHVEELVERLAAMEPKIAKRKQQPLRKTG